MHRHGITFPFMGLPLAEQRVIVEEIADLGYTDLWSYESDSYDAFSPLVLAAEWAPQLRLGTAIVPVYTRGPALIAQSTATLAEASGGRFVLGLGASSDVIVARWNGVPFDRPFTRVGETVRWVRSALAGEKVTGEYETITASGFRLALKVHERVPIMVAALRPGMLRLAGREADGAIINWLAAADVARVVPYVHEGGENKEIVARLFVLPTEDAETARTVGKRMIAAYLNVPVYAAFHEWLGRGDVLKPMWDAWAAGDRAGALAAIPDSLVDELFIYGSPAAIRDHIDEYHRQGVTTSAPMLMPVGNDLRQSIRDIAPR